MLVETLRELQARAKVFKAEATAVLATQETAESARVHTLNETYKLLTLLNLKQDDLMRQALRCTEFELYRAAHVMAWAAAMDFIQEKLASDGLVRLRSVRPKWQGIDIHEMAEYVPESQLLDVLKDLNLATKNEVKALRSLLDRRNECAHPTDYYPGINETLGYISELLQRVGRLSPKTL